MKKACITLLSLGLLAGCGKESAQTATSPGDIEVEESSGGEVADGGRCVITEEGQEISEYDTSGDTTPDVRKLFTTKGEGSLARLVLTCREADLNDDGRKDVVRFYNEEGRPLREEADRDFDGQIDEITYFTKGRITRQEIDESGNGVIDTRIYYEEGEPIRAERDLAGRSTASEWRPDRWEYYVDGRTVRVGTDIDGDGKVDRWDRDEERLSRSSVAQEQSTEDSASQ